MAKLELISPEGLRLDGRRAGELRRIHCKMGVFTKADGSAFFQQGNTQVVVAIYGPREVRPFFPTTSFTGATTIKYRIKLGGGKIPSPP